MEVCSEDVARSLRAIDAQIENLERTLEQLDMDTPLYKQLSHELQEYHQERLRLLSSCSATPIIATPLPPNVIQEQFLANADELQHVASERYIAQMNIDQLQKELYQQQSQSDRISYEQRLEKERMKIQELNDAMHTLTQQNYELKRMYEDAESQLKQCMSKQGDYIQQQRLYDSLVATVAQKQNEINELRDIIALQGKQRDELSVQMNLIREQAARLERERQKLESNLLFTESKNERELNKRLQECKLKATEVAQNFLLLQDRYVKIDEQYRQAEERSSQLIEVLKRTEDNKRELQLARQRIQELQQAFQSPSPQYVARAREDLMRQEMASEMRVPQLEAQTLRELNIALTSQSPQQLEKTIESIESHARQKDMEHTQHMLQIRAQSKELDRQAAKIASAKKLLLESAEREVRDASMSAVSVGRKRASAYQLGVKEALDNLQRAQTEQYKTTMQELKQNYSRALMQEQAMREEILPEMAYLAQTSRSIPQQQIAHVKQALEDAYESARVKVEQSGNKTESARREISLLEDRFQVLKQRRGELSQAIDKWMNEPSPEARTNVIRLAQQDERQYFDLARAQQELKSEKPITLNVVAKPGGGLALNQETNVVTVKLDGKTYVYPFDSSSVLGNPAKLMKVAVPRFDQAVTQNRDLIVIGYSYVNVSGTRKRILQQCILKIWSTIQSFAGSNQNVTLFIVSIAPDNQRNDMIAATMSSETHHSQRPSNCEWNNCSLESKTFTLLSSTTPDEFSRFITHYYPDNPADVVHMVTTIQINNHVIHIVDMTIDDSSERELKLMDRSWISYLRPTLLQDQYYIDLLLIIQDNDTMQDAERNTKLLNLNARIASFLEQFRSLQLK